MASSSLFFFAYGTVHVAESAERVRCLVTVLGRVCGKTKLIVNVERGNVMVMGRIGITPGGS